MRRPRFGKLPRRYLFALNPHTEYRATRCPNCNGLTRQRKFALMIHVAPDHFLALGKACRFCPKCELIIAHRDELEDQLTDLFDRLDPEAIGNDYLVLGTVERKAWREGMRQSKAIDEMLEHTADFKGYWDIEYEPGGWYPAEK